MTRHRVTNGLGRQRVSILEQAEAWVGGGDVPRLGAHCKLQPLATTPTQQASAWFHHASTTAGLRDVHAWTVSRRW